MSQSLIQTLEQPASQSNRSNMSKLLINHRNGSKDGDFNQDKVLIRRCMNRSTKSNRAEHLSLCSAAPRTIQLDQDDY
tara:strand:+ start:603 stop:836 length:234 start_codon:yes stop_codon:yes gene_type:complete